MKTVLNRPFLTVLMLSALCFSCIDSKFDLDNIDDSGGLTPSLVLPIGNLKTGVNDFIKGAGIDDPLQASSDTLYFVYRSSISLSPSIPVLDFDDNGVMDNIPADIQFTIDGGRADLAVSLFRNLESRGSALYFSNPKFYFTVHNYIGTDITVDINRIFSYNSRTGQQETAVFDSEGSTSYRINVASAPAPHEYSVSNELFDRTKGRTDKLFSIAPERISYDLGITFDVPDDGNHHFLVRDKYVDIEYEIRIPFTLGPGTRLANVDTLEFDLSGEGFVNNIGNLTLWADYKNSLQTTIDLDFVFLDEYKHEIPDITRHFHMNAAPSVTRDVMPRPARQVATGDFELQFNENEFDNARKAKYVILKSILRTDNQGNDDVNIHPQDYIDLKLSAYSKINL
jgi:hypothetical protein